MCHHLIIGALLLHTAAGPAIAQQVNSRSASSERRAGSISGRVIGDDGQPLAYASITIVRQNKRRDPDAWPGKEESVPLRETSADDKGKFRVEDLQPGVYSIYAWKPGFVDSSQPKYYRVGDVVTLDMVKGGVITGTVTTSTGEPVIGVQVQAMLVRDVDGQSIGTPRFLGRRRQTDDRGVYRLYGLRPGTYIVVANGPGFSSGGPNAFEEEAPTYFPSSTRDAAAEVTVRGGGEASGIDIKYRAERGYSISGTVSGGKAPNPAAEEIIIELRHAASGATEETTSIYAGENKRTFAFRGVPDGEYQVVARSMSEGDYDARSPGGRVVVRGADVAGVALLLEPLGSISGRVILENKPGAEHKDNCKSTRESFIDEITLIARRDILKQKTNQSVSLRGVSREYIPDEKGEFLFRALEPGQYRIDTRENWYIRAMTLQSTGNAKMDDPVRNGISIKPGQRLTGLTITVAEGAASLRGRVTAANEGSSSPERLRVHIIPAEREQADNILRFRETSVQSDGSFEIKNIAPGRYWLITRPISDEELDESNPRPAVWDASKRIMLRREVEASSTVIEFHPCQRIVDYVLRYGPAVSKPAYIK